MLGTPTILELLEGLADAFNSHDIDRVMSFFAPNCSLECQEVRNLTGHGLWVSAMYNVAWRCASNRRQTSIMQKWSTSLTAQPECPNGC